VATALKRTIEVQKDIDGIYPKIEEETISFSDKKG
jgi:hypothetical protein